MLHRLLFNIRLLSRIPISTVLTIFIHLLAYTNRNQPIADYTQSIFPVPISNFQSYSQSPEAQFLSKQQVKRVNLMKTQRRRLLPNVSYPSSTKNFISLIREMKEIKRSIK